MGKRGQLTLFVVLGLVVLVLIALVIYFRASITETISKNVLNKDVVLPNEVRKVQDHVQGCVNDMSVILLYQLGGQGGLLNPSADKGIVDDNIAVAYGYYNGKNMLPSLSDFRKDFSMFMNSFLPQCLKMADFGKLQVTPSKPSSNLEFLDNNVRVSVDYPVTVAESENVYNLRDPYEVVYPLRIKFLHDLGDGIVKKTVSDPKNIDVSYLLGLGIKVDVYPYDNNTFVYSLSDSKSVVANTTYEYRFAVRHGK